MTADLPAAPPASPSRSEPISAGNLETCPSCGWVSFASDRRRRCEFCGGPRRPVAVNASTRARAHVRRAPTRLRPARVGGEAVTPAEMDAMESVSGLWDILETGKSFVWGTWRHKLLAANDSRRKQTAYYGSFPTGLWDEIHARYPADPERTLHLFSGSLPRELGYRATADPKVECEYIGLIPDSFRQMENGRFDLIIADPPYTPLDAAKYGLPYPDKRKVLRESRRVLTMGGHMVWLDIRSPNNRKKEFKTVAMRALLPAGHNRVVRSLTTYEAV